MSCFRTASGLCFNQIIHFCFTNDHRDNSEISESTRTLDTSFSVAFEPTTVHLSAVPLVIQLKICRAAASELLLETLKCVALRTRTKCRMQIEKRPNTPAQ